MNLEKYIGINLSSRRTQYKINKWAIGIAKAFVSVIFILYGFLAFINPEAYPLLRKTIHISKFDPILGILLMIIGIYLIIRKIDL